jgi:hypothetical protein
MRILMTAVYLACLASAAFAGQPGDDQGALSWVSFGTAILSLAGAAIGGGIGAVYTLRQTKKTVMDEEIARRKVAANAEAYAILDHVRLKAQHSPIKKTLLYVHSHHDWFRSNRIFLTDKCAERWTTIIRALSFAEQHAEYLDIPASSRSDDAATRKLVADEATAAMDGILSEMGLNPIGDRHMLKVIDAVHQDQKSEGPEVN